MSTRCSGGFRTSWSLPRVDCGGVPSRQMRSVLFRGPLAGFLSVCRAGPPPRRGGNGCPRTCRNERCQSRAPRVEDRGGDPQLDAAQDTDGCSRDEDSRPSLTGSSEPPDRTEAYGGRGFGRHEYPIAIDCAPDEANCAARRHDQHEGARSMLPKCCRGSSRSCVIEPGCVVKVGHPVTVRPRLDSRSSRFLDLAR